MDQRGIAVRPHAKTHKSVAVARRQLAAGARGITVGTIGEAEVFAEAGIDDLFLAYPIWAGGSKGDRVRALHDAAAGVPRRGRLGRTGPGGWRRRSHGVGRPLRVLVEVDPGLHRTGVPSPDVAVEVARAARDAGLEVIGVFSHGGHGYAPGALERAGADEVRTLTAAAEALRAAGFEITTISAGATPTILSAAAGAVNEMRAGTSVYGDRQQWVLGSIPAEGCAVAVAATVVSVFDDRIVLDAGAKALTKDRADWLTGFGAIAGYPELVIERLSDYHGVVTASGRAPRGRSSARSSRSSRTTSARSWTSSTGWSSVDADGSVEEWPVDARGRSG